MPSKTTQTLLPGRSRRTPSSVSRTSYTRFSADGSAFGRTTLSVLFRPAFHDLQKYPRSMKLAARSGMIRHWRETGAWPDFCFNPDLPYDCKTEAAKLADLSIYKELSPFVRFPSKADMI